MTIFDTVKNPYMMADGGAGGSAEPNNEPNTEPNNEPNNEPTKTFTQEQVNGILASEKKKNIAAAYKALGFESSDEASDFINKYKELEEKQKSDLTKANEKLEALEIEKKAEKQKAEMLERKFDAISKGCDPNNAEEVVLLATAKMTDEKDFETALNEVKEKYPTMFETVNKSTGSGGTPPKGKQIETDGIGKRLAEQYNNGNQKKETYFKN